MASGISGAAQLRNNYGMSVARAAGNLAQTGNLTLFTVAGGRILLTNIVGAVTTAIQAQANAVKLQTLSTTGAIATDLCATVETNGAAVGNLFGITGVQTAAAVLGSNVPRMATLVVAAGVIRMNAAASNTGQMSWALTYIPLDAGAYVTAA